MEGSTTDAQVFCDSGSPVELEASVTDGCCDCLGNVPETLTLTISAGTGDCSCAVTGDCTLTHVGSNPMSDWAGTLNLFGGCEEFGPYDIHMNCTLDGEGNPAWFIQLNAGMDSNTCFLTVVSCDPLHFTCEASLNPSCTGTVTIDITE
jgi:hypothetical protein